MIRVNLDVMLAKRRLSSGELAERLGITPANLSILKTNKDSLCRILECQPADILEYVPDTTESEAV